MSTTDSQQLAHIRTIIVLPSACGRVVCDENPCVGACADSKGAGVTCDTIRCSCGRPMEPCGDTLRCPHCDIPCRTRPCTLCRRMQVKQ